MYSPIPLGRIQYTSMSKSKRTSSTVRKSSRATLRGRGDYSVETKSIRNPAERLEAKIDHLERSLVKTTPTIKNAASSIGRTLGNFINQGDLGALAGEGLSRLFGHGDYNVRTNSLLPNAKHAGPNPPKFSNNGRRGTRLTEREFVCDISSGPLFSGSSDFTITKYPLLCSDRTTFPWLSTLALQFDQWEPHGIVFEFISSSSEFNGTSQALGTVIMATDYDIDDPTYPSKQVMENADYSCSTRPSNCLIHGIECDPKERPTEILYTSVGNPNKANLSSLGNFQVATVGCSTANCKLGELWVSYDITFYKKQLVLPAQSSTVLCRGGVAALNGPYIGGTTFIDVNRGIVIQTVVGTGVNLLFPATQGSGKYEFTYYLGLINVGDNPTFVYTNCVATSTLGNVTVGQVYNYTTVVQITRPGAYISVNGTKLVAPQNYHCTLCEVPDDFNYY